MRSLVLTLGFLALTASALGQGSIGGFGQGGQAVGMGGGGMGGGAMPGSSGGRFSPGNRKADDEKSRPGMFDNIRWNTQTMIATAGVGCDWKFEGKAGEVLVAEAVSEVFDASIRVLDEKGKVLAENDDRSEGNQSPLIVFRFERDQTIKVNVGSFKNASGGKFEFRNFLYKSFTPKPATDELELGEIPRIRQEGAYSALVHFKGKKNQVYSIDRIQLFGKNGYWSWLGSTYARFFGPTGVEVNDFELIENETNGRYKTVKALRDGDYFLEFSVADWYVSGKIKVRPISVQKRETLGTTSFNLAADEQIMVQFPVLPTQVLRTVISETEPGASVLQGPAIPKEAGNVPYGGEGDDLWGSTNNFTYFKLKSNSREVARVFHAKGDARLILTNLADKPSVFTVTTDAPVSELKSEANMEAKLGIGESALYRYDSIKNEMMRLRTEADGFRLKVEILNYRGQVLNTFLDNISNKPGDDLYFPEADKYLFRVTCVGNGGSGTYRLRRDPINTSSLALNEKKTIVLDGKSFGIYEVSLEAGKRYAINSQYGAGTATFMTMAEDGQVIPAKGYQFDNVRSNVLTIEKTGKYRIWVRGGGNANVTFKIAPYKPPTIDD